MEGTFPLCCWNVDHRKALFLTSGSAGYLQDDVLTSNPSVAVALTASDILVK
jgi:hypothetical protein